MSSATAAITVVILDPPINYNPPPTVSIERFESRTFFPTGIDAQGRGYTEFDIEVFACDPEFNPCREVTNDFRIAWYTDRADLQGPFLLAGRAGRVRLYGGPLERHEVTVIVSDSGPEEGSATAVVLIPAFGPR